MPIRSIVPLFRVPDVDRTAAWYRDELGCAVDPFPETSPWEFAILRLGPAEIMLRRSGEPKAPDPKGGWDAYIRLDGDVIRMLHEQLADRGHVVRALQRMPYGNTEFEIRDCDGRRLCFGEFLHDASGIPAAAES